MIESMVQDLIHQDEAIARLVLDMCFSEEWLLILHY